MGLFSIFQKRRHHMKAPKNIVIVYDDQLINEVRRENLELLNQLVELTNVIKDIRVKIDTIISKDTVDMILI